MTTRTRLLYGITLLAFLIFIALFTSQRAATQQPAAAVGVVAETLYAPAGVTQVGPASVAWFIAAPKSGEQYPVACKLIAESFACKKGTFQ